MKKTTRKLSLKTETVRRLTQHDLELVAGGRCKHGTTGTHGGGGDGGGGGNPNDPPPPPPAGTPGC